MLLAKSVTEEALRRGAILSRGQAALHLARVRGVLSMRHHALAMKRNNYDFFIVFELFFVGGEAAVFVVTAGLRSENH